ncbi:MAG: LamG domain-containing protein [Armatimonadetes bacterium]|nr:LamG domain-containing protein [Armatimonadota bacterium]
MDEEEGRWPFYNPTDLSLTPGSWCHVVATYDGAAMRFDINGREGGTGKEVRLTIRKTSEPLRINWLGSYGHFNGRVRDVATYSRAMSAGEVCARYRVGKARLFSVP